MASTAPLTPTPEGFEAERFAEWLPTSYWAISDDKLETIVSFNKSDFNHDLGSAYSVKLEYYDRKNEPIFRHCLKPDEVVGRNFRVRLREVREQHGLDRLDGLMLVSVRNETVGTPSRPYFITTWGTYVSPDGRNVMSFPGQPIIGAEKSYRGFQVWPGLICDGTFETFVVMINPFNRSQEFTFHAFDLNGKKLSGTPMTIARKHARRVWITDAIPGVREHLASTGGLGSLTVESAYKIVLFGGAENKTNGYCNGMDHFSPFLVPMGGH